MQRRPTYSNAGAGCSRRSAGSSRASRSSSRSRRGGLPEVAFAGRSNVGKSSLINALTGRRTLAKVSNTPGRTRQLNFFDLGGRLMLADLPGYGYARASKEQVANWTRLVELYLIGRAPLRRALLLIDARHGLKDVDRRVMAMLDKAAVSYQVVLTKIDQLAPAAACRTTGAYGGRTRQAHGGAPGGDADQRREGNRASPSCGPRSLR